MSPENTLSGGSQSSFRSQTTYCVIPLYEMSRIGKSIEIESRLAVVCGWGCGAEWQMMKWVQSFFPW